jgi:hypothetical protein
LGADVLSADQGISGRQLRAFVTPAAILIIVISLAGLLVPIERWRASSDFLPEHVEAFSLYNSARQRFVHFLWLGLTAVAGVLALYGPMELLRKLAAGRFTNRFIAFYERYAFAISIALIAALLIWALALRPRYNRLEPMIASIAILYVLASWPKWTDRSFRSLSHPLVFAVLFVAYLAALNLPGLLLNIEFNAARFVSSNDYHYAALLSGIEQIRAQLDPSMVRFNYGVLWKYLGAGILDSLGATSFGSYVRLMQGYQLLFAAVFIASAYLWGRGNLLFVLFASACVLPWVATMNLSVWAPNQSGVRFLPFALLPALLVAMRAMNEIVLRAIFAGAGSAFLFLWNGEVGIAAAIGLGFAVLLAAYMRGGSIIMLIGLAVIFAAAVAVTAAILLYVVSGGTQSLFSILLSVSDAAAGGYSGLPIQLDLFALAIGLFATSVALGACVAARLRDGDDGMIERGAIAVTILIFFAYYLNRPHPWNLWSFVLLAVFMLEPMTRQPFWRGQPNGIGALIRKPAIFALALTMLFVPLHANFTYLRSQKPVTTQPPNISGVRLPLEIVNSVKEQAGFVTQLGKRDVVYLSATQFLMATVTQRVNRMRSFDPFGQILSPSHMRRFMSEIENAGPDCVLIEVESSPSLVLNKPRQQLFDRLRGALAEKFQLAGEQSGWQVWQAPSRQPCIGKGA